ncbi:MAG: copper chaperone PCu(A)C, partial [Anaerolineales bacterium]|nr:copper chaperone PCu(A)C [Anaerolineales bacterium]
VDVPARGQVELKPGGLHIMLIGLSRDLKAGDQVSLSLGFEKSGEIKVEAEVRAP